LAIDNKIWDLSPGEAPDFSAPDLLLDASPTCITYDQTGNLWMGTNGYGLRKLNPTQALFHAGAVGMSIRGIWAGGDRYLVRDQLFNIRTYDPKTGDVSSQAAFQDTPSRIVNLAFGPAGDIWVLYLPEGSGNTTLRHYLPGSLVADAEYKIDARLNVFDPLLYTPDGRLWMALNQCRLVGFDTRTKQFTYHELAHLFGEKASAVKALSLAQDGNGTLWVGTQSGLVKCQPKPAAAGTGFDFQLYRANADNPKGLNNNVINHLLPDPAAPGKTLWLATKGGGINRMDIYTGECRHLTTDDGLLNEVVYGILPARKPTGGTELWCSTNRGLAKLVERPGGEIEITTFTAALGLQDNEFNTYAFCKSDKGELLFGGVNGLNRFFPEQLKKNAAPPPVFIVGLEINHQKADFGSPQSPLTQPLESLKELRLRHDQNNLSFEFAALDFTDPSKNRYRYRLVGLDDGWVETGNLRFAHFNHLPPGSYEFRVQGSNGESDWADAVNPVSVVILPPWWRSKLAYFCYFLLLAWSGWRVWQFQIRRVKEREQLNFEQRETERLKKLEQMKTNFFSNVTHELRTPLTLMMEPLRQALPKIKDPAAYENVRLAERNSRRLLSLVNQLLDMAKIESGSMTLDLRRNDFVQTVREVYEAFLPLATRRNIALTLVPPIDLSPFDFDPGKVELVLNNLISNALKFTPEGGVVKLEIGKLGNWEIGELGNWGIGELGNWVGAQFLNFPIPNFQFPFPSPTLALASPPGRWAKFSTVFTK
jgi:signal transduction histidine kinase